jgi:HD-GYP domain-containing protein (c-di-GMP phosphodiesterase class II)
MSSREITELGRALIYQLFVLMKTSKNYREGHSAMKLPAARLLKTVRDIKASGEEAALTLKGGYMLLGEQRLKPDASGFEGFKFLMSEMKRYFIGSINFTSSAKEADIGRLPYIFSEVEPIPSPQTFDKLSEMISRQGIEGIELEILPEEEKTEEDDTDERERAKRLYSQTLAVASEVMENVKMGQTLKLRKAKRAIQGMVDQLLTAEINLIGLTTIHCHDEYTYNHSVNVCILSLAIGQRVGLNKETLCQLGIASLFHDMGKADVPLNILNKPSEFTPEEWAVMQRHPIYGVKTLMQIKGLDPLNTRVVAGAFEHHLNYDLSGYPKVPYRREMSLFGKIISIADCYDGLTSSRVYCRTPRTPDEAIRFMTERAGKVYDPVLMKLFVNCVGIYPIGSLLLLNTGELAVIVENNPDPDKWDKPRVKVISDAAKNEIEGYTIGLSDKTHGKSITKTLNPEKYKIDIGRYFT